MSHPILSQTTDRIYYLDYLRGLMVLWVVLDHSMHGYTHYFSNMWFIQDFEKSLFLDAWHLHNDAIMMPFMFFLAGLFVFSSLERRGIVSYLKERFWRLCVPLIAGVIFIAPFMSYDKSVINGTVEGGYFEFWKSIILDFNDYPLDKATASGFWFLTYLILLTLGAMMLYGVFPWLRRAFQRYATWIFQNPSRGIFSLIFIVCLLNTLSDLRWGAHYWFTFKPFFGVRQARFLVKIVFFLMGIACADAGFLKDPTLIARLKNCWKLWAIVAGVVLMSYITYVITYVNEGAYNVPLAYYIYQFQSFPDWSMAMRLIEDEGLLVIGRTVLLSLVMVTLSLFYLSFFGKNLNKPSPFWLSLSVCSYGIYIFHEPFVTYMNRLMYDQPFDGMIKFIGAAMVSLLVSWLLTHVLINYVPLSKKLL